MPSCDREVAMSIIENSRRLMAVCDECGAVFAGIEKADGDITPIGRPGGCECGSSSFSEYETA